MTSKRIFNYKAWKTIGVSISLIIAFCSHVLAQIDEDFLDNELPETVEVVLENNLEFEEAGDLEWLVAPVPSYNGAFGWTVALPVAALYHPPSVPLDQPAWISGVGGFYAENGSWGAAAYQRMNLKNDKWRVWGTVFYSDLVYKVYGIGDIGGDPDWYFELGQEAYGGMAEGLRRVAPNLYFGLRTAFIYTEIHTLTLPNFDKSLDLDLGLLGLNINLNSLIPRVVYDTRDNEFYPQGGNYASAQVKLDSDSWGSDFDYQIYSAELNHYHGLTDNQVLAFRVAGKYADGSVPFFLLPALGNGSDLRGYKPGIYRDNLLLSGQAEYRHRFTERIGAVAFYGMATIGSDWDDLDRTFHSGGVGLRYVLAPENNISFRFDVAWGEGEPEFYFSLGEAF